MAKIGITTTVPVEVLIAAGCEVVDLNNIFIASDDYHHYIDIAEREGFPKSCCAWKKGIFGACIEHGIKEIVSVTEGDCSNSKALEEVLKSYGTKTYTFSYPESRELPDIKYSINRFMSAFGIAFDKVETERQRLGKVRKLIKKLDTLTYVDNKTTGFENHLYQVSSSDFNSNVGAFERDIVKLISEIEVRESNRAKIRLGYIGTPPMTCDIYDYVEGFESRFVYNEVQREFSFPRWNRSANIYEQYLDYTYPYDIYFRIDEIRKQIEERNLDGIIHYTQAFCHRQIEDIVIKKQLDIPILTIEGDKLNRLDARTKLRIEAFLDMLLDLKEMKS